NYWFLEGGHNPKDYAEQAHRVRDAGFTGLKFDPFAHTNYLYGDHLSSNLSLKTSEQDLAFSICEAVRTAVGPDMDIMIETHAMLNLKTPIQMESGLSDLNITSLEEPDGPENTNTLRAMRERLNPSISICVGERHYTRLRILPL